MNSKRVLGREKSKMTIEKESRVAGSSNLVATPLKERLCEETLLDIAIFLVRIWSGKNSIKVEISDRIDTRTSLFDGTVIMGTPEKRQGNGFQRYRHFRTSLWYESMRVKYCEKILSNDHAFGFILNTMETKRVEELGKRIWQGMNQEIMVWYAYSLIERPHLDKVYGRARMVEAFYQQFMFGTTKGQIQESHLERVRKATIFADEIIHKAIRDGHHTSWVERHVSRITEILQIDSLLTIPGFLPFTRTSMALNEKELQRAFKVASQKRQRVVGGDASINSQDTKYTMDTLTGNGEIYNEYKTLLVESKKDDENTTRTPEHIGIRTPSTRNVDGSAIYDAVLISGLKTRFKEWRSGWKEVHLRAGDEFDEEIYIEGGQHKSFISDARLSIKTRIMILLDHSSSIASEAIEYKKATLALCEVLAFLKVGFAVYAFSTQNRSVVCWTIKHDKARWGGSSVRRLAQVAANGSTPLADVYTKMFPVVQAMKPDIFLTLTDGEPSDPSAVRNMTRSFKSLGIKMVALGIGTNTVRATAVVDNLKHLGYERAVAVSRLVDIPSKVMSVLDV